MLCLYDFYKTKHEMLILIEYNDVNKILYTKNIIIRKRETKMMNITRHLFINKY